MTTIEEEDIAAMDEFFTQLWNLILVFGDPRNLPHPERYVDALKAPGVMWTAFAAVNLIVFTETGLLIGFLLPGDSLLVVTGIVARTAEWPMLPLTLSLIACHLGMNVRGGAQGVGDATTKTVVYTIVALTFIDLGFTAVFYYLGF